MEEGIKEIDPFLYPALQLAYIGDVVFEKIIRTRAMKKGIRNVKTLHRESSSYARAKTQAELSLIITELLEDDEKAILKRGRNAKSHTVPKNALLADYKNATAFEAVIGYLYMKKNEDRINYLVNYAIDKYDYEVRNK